MGIKYYRIRYVGWNIEDSFYARCSMYSRLFAITMFKNMFPSEESDVICDVVNVVH